MTPPGLTCAHCHESFARQLARRTLAGWVHVARCHSAAELSAGRWVWRHGVARWVDAH